MLDARPLRTPAKAPLVVPARALAEALAAEWQAQEGQLRPETMPLTRAANAAIDRVAPQRTAVVAEILRYGETDLLCYRAAAPRGLAARQAAAWDPLLDWAAGRFGARLIPVAGVMPMAQPAPALAALEAAVARFESFGLTGLHELVALSGSLVIGLAAAHRADDPEALWQATRIDEDWQIEQWGEDAEAARAAAAHAAAFRQALHFLRLAGAVEGPRRAE
jgi:chaperone required for assembly of F1-ATPase